MLKHNVIGNRYTYGDFRCFGEHMDHYSRNSVGNLAILSLLFAVVLFLCIWLSANPAPVFFPFRSYSCPQPNISMAMNAEKDELEAALESASMENRTVIIAVVNKAYVEGDVGKTMLDLFLESFWLGYGTRKLVDHLLIVTVDQAAYERCRFRRLHCYRLVTDGVDFGGEKLYMSKEFIKMMWRRTQFLLDVLKRGYNFIFTDTDVMWLRDPFRNLSHDQAADLQISTDVFNGDPTSAANAINTGFYYIKSNNRTVSLFSEWYAMRDNSTGQKEQDVLLKLMRGGLFARLGLRVRFLDTRRFSGFCTDSDDLRAVATVHANCCRSIGAKVADLTAVLRDWKRFNALFARRRGRNEGKAVAAFRWSKHVGCVNSWKHTAG